MRRRIRVGLLAFSALVVLACPAGLTAEEGIEQFQQALMTLAERVRPAVVLVTSEREISALPDVPDIQWVPSSAEDMPSKRGRPQTRRFIQRSVASGFVIDRAGHVVTLARALNLPARIRVKSIRGDEGPVRLMGVDECSNVAVLELEDQREDFLPAPLAEEPVFRIGQWVASIANPYGLEGSVSPGTVSGVNRYLESLSACYLGLVQITNPINPGEIGGALAGLDGRVVGMLCSSYADSVQPIGNGANVNFAIPIDQVLRSARQIIEEGRVAHGWLGVTVAAPQDGSQGAVVVSVASETPAALAGLQPGDLIVGLGPERVLRPRHLQALVLASRPGTSVELNVLRVDERRKVTVQLCQSPPEAYACLSQTSRGWLGAGMKEINGEMRAAFGLEGLEGVLITETVHGSPVVQAGLRAGDVVLEIARQKVRGLVDCQRYLSEWGPGEELDLKVFRDGDVLSRRVRLVPFPPGAPVPGIREDSRPTAPTAQEILEQEVLKLRQEVEALRKEVGRLQNPPEP
ncbi:MAG: PDZ domain-containing protein [Planctomycetes bacterium]|nr:PDZ domain-containing protein [Planctomycetota bacterium]